MNSVNDSGSYKVKSVLWKPCKHYATKVLLKVYPTLLL